MDARARLGPDLVADVVVSAVGMFNEVATPAIPGLDAFAGTVFHSARWNTEHDLTGETVGVIGSAASAVQLVPEIVKQAARVHLFQRTANWIAPKQDDPYTEKQLDRLRNDPGFAEKIRRNIFDSLGGPGHLRARAPGHGGRVPRRHGRRRGRGAARAARAGPSLGRDAPALLERLVRRRSTGRTSSSSPTRSSASPRPASRPATAASAGSTR